MECLLQMKFLISQCSFDSFFDECLRKLITRSLCSRFCEPKTGQHGVKWMLPDFSGCVADSLKDIYEQVST